MLPGPCARRSWTGDRQPHCRSEADPLPITTRGTASDAAGQVCCSLYTTGFLHSTPSSLVDGAVGSEGDRGSQQCRKEPHYSCCGVSDSARHPDVTGCRDVRGQSPKSGVTDWQLPSSSWRRTWPSKEKLRRQTPSARCAQAATAPLP